MNDLTVIFLTNNELPEKWNKFQQGVLLDAVGNNNLVSVSRKPMNLGTNILQLEPKCLSNIYWQMLKVCKMVDTQFIAVAEDDTLYPAEHFNFRPPKLDTFYYNRTHWSLYTWMDNPMYSWRDRQGNYTLVAPRELVIEALEERFAKWPDGTPNDLTGELGRNMVEKNLGITLRKKKEFYTTVGVVNFNHAYSQDDRQKRQRKRMGYLRAYDIPYWGKAKDLIEKFR